MRPVVLPPNPVRRFYRGGAAIAALRGEPPPSERVPEDWVGSTTEVLGEPGVGPSRLEDGRLLRDAIAADPEPWLGASHVDRWGSDPVLLVKLLDAGERLPVHVHPDGPFARRHLGRPFGKTEAWIVVGGEGEVRLGWRGDVDEPILRRWIADQDADAMLEALHPVAVAPGDAVFVPAGVAHAIGQDLLIVELQEPSDMSVLLEWRGHGIAGEHEAHLDLGWDLALEAVERTARDPADLAGPPAGDAPRATLLPRAADGFFRAERVRPGPDGPVGLDPGFAVLTVVQGSGVLTGEGWDEVPVRRGDGVAVPHAAGAVEVRGDLEIVRCRPPAPDAVDPKAR